MPYLTFLQQHYSRCAYCDYGCHAPISPRYCPSCGYPNWAVLGSEKPVWRAEGFFAQYIDLSPVSTGADPAARTRRF